MKTVLSLITLYCAFLSAAQAQSNASGSWYNPAQSGHGLAVDQLSPESALMLWFTYEGTGNPMPLYVEAKRRDGAFTGTAYEFSGPHFGDFAPDSLFVRPWGTLSFEPQGCGAGTLRWNADDLYPSPTFFGVGATPMRPLALLACGGPPVPSPLAGVSGTWYHPQLQGMGFHVQVLDATSALIYWFTYNDRGNPLQLYIEARIDGPRMTGTALAPHGMRFGSFARADLRLHTFGTVQIEFQDCDSATVRYDTTLGAEQFALTRLTRPQGIDCTMPDSRPEWAATLYTGESREASFPTFEHFTAVMLLNARDEVMVSSSGVNRVRGQLRRDGDRTFMQVDAFDATYDREIHRDPESGEIFVRFVELGDTVGRYPYEINLHPAPVQPLPDPAAELPGTYGDLTTPYSTQVTIGHDRRITFVQGSQSERALKATGRVTHVDAASGVFDFDLRFARAAGSTTADQRRVSEQRMFGSGALLRGPDGDRLLLLGEGIQRLPVPPATAIRPPHVNVTLPRRDSP